MNLLQKTLASSHDGGVGRYAFSHNQKMDNNQFKNKKTELPDNQGVKEETFIQTGRKDRDGQPGWRGHVARQWLVDPDSKLALAELVAQHLCIDKPGGTNG